MGLSVFKKTFWPWNAFLDLHGNAKTSIITFNVVIYFPCSAESIFDYICMHHFQNGIE